VITAGKQPGNIRRCDPAAAQLLKVLVGRPTGDGAPLSDEHWDFVIAQLRQQLTHRRKTSSFELVGVVTEQKLGRVTGEDDGGLVPDLD
jgi:hypothetical protein